MYVLDGIAYAGKLKPGIKVCGVRPLVGHKQKCSISHRC